MLVLLLVNLLLLLDLVPLDVLLLSFHLVLNASHLHRLFKTLIILVLLLLMLEQLCLVSLHLVLILTINLGVRLGLVHDLVQALRKDELRQVLLIDPLLLHLCFSDSVEVPLLIREDRFILRRAPTRDAH
jgi:hypothetical protein